MSDKGDIQNMQGRGACRTGLKTTALGETIHQFYAAMLPGSLGQSSSQIVKNTVETCAVLR